MRVTKLKFRVFGMMIAAASHGEADGTLEPSSGIRVQNAKADRGRPPFPNSQRQEPSLGQQGYVTGKLTAAVRVS